MNAQLLLCALAFAAVLRAEDAPPAPGGEAVEIAKRSLPFVREKGIAWIEKRECTSCHQVPSMLWSQNSAARLGLGIDRRELAGRTTWAADWRHWNQKGDGSFEKIAPANVDTMVFLLLGRDASADKDAEWTRDFRAALLKAQQPDGSWKPQGQLPLGKRPAREITEVTTMWTLLALGSYAADAPASEARTRADAFLATAQPGRSTEWHAARLLLQPGSEPLRTALLGQQHPDGGWGWLTADPSDAFGTGLALYALARGGLPADAEAVRRAIALLKATQQPDGSWPVPSTRAKDKNKVNPTATYWGTAWAVIGLLESQTAPGK